MKISLIEDKDFKNTASMIERSVRFSQFSKFYPQSEIDNVVKSLDEERVIINHDFCDLWYYFLW